PEHDALLGLPRLLPDDVLLGLQLFLLRGDGVGVVLVLDVALVGDGVLLPLELAGVGAGLVAGAEERHQQDDQPEEVAAPRPAPESLLAHRVFISLSHGMLPVFASRECRARGGVRRPPGVTAGRPSLLATAHEAALVAPSTLLRAAARGGR